MGEHATNERALAAKTFPSFPPAGRVCGVGLGLSVVPKGHIYVVNPGVPIDEVAQAEHAKACQEQNLPAQELHVLGNALAPEKCDVVLHVGCEYGNPAMAGPRGTPTGRIALPIVLGRFDYQHLVKSCEDSLPARGLLVVP